jgi:hypothetical protein
LTVQNRSASRAEFCGVETKHDTVTEPRGLGKYAQWIREARTKFGVNKIEFLLDGVPKDIRVKPRT